MLTFTIPTRKISFVLLKGKNQTNQARKEGLYYSGQVCLIVKTLSPLASVSAHAMRTLSVCLCAFYHIMSLFPVSINTHVTVKDIHNTCAGGLAAFLSNDM